MWTDIEFACTPTDERLRAAFATAFDVALDAVMTMPDELAAENPWDDPQLRVLLKRNRQPGDFPLHVMVILGPGEIRHKVQGWDREVAMVQRLCEELGCRALISDDDPDPYRWILITPQASPRAVDVDPDQMDEADALVLVEDEAARRIA